MCDMVYCWRVYCQWAAVDPLLSVRVFQCIYPLRCAAWHFSSRRARVYEYYHPVPQSMLSQHFDAPVRLLCP